RRSFTIAALELLYVLPHILSLVIRQFFKPAETCRIVVCAGVNHCIGDVVVREIGVIRMTVEGELQDPSPRQLKLVAECVYVRRDQSQILDDERQTAQLTLDCLKEISSWTGDPLSRLCSRCAGGDVPGRGKGTEMIQANHIDVGQQ